MLYAYINFFTCFSVCLYMHIHAVQYTSLRVTFSVESLSSNSAITSQHLRKAVLKRIGRYMLRLICFVCYLTYSIPMKAGSKIRADVNGNKVKFIMWSSDPDATSC